MPENVLKKLYAKILPVWKVCFFAAVAVGLLAHAYKITNWLPNWDSLVFRYDPQNMVGMGRWFLPVVCSPSSFYDLPFLSGLLAIVFHALGAVCVCNVLNVQKKITAFLIGAVIASFPTVTSVMMYNYVADGYSIAFFLSVLAAFYMTKEKPKYPVAVLCIALSAGIYQAYLTVTVMLILLKLIDSILYREEAPGKIFKKTLHMLFTGVLGVAVYSAVLKAVLALFSMELLAYQGIDQTASLSNLNLAASLYTVKETFVKCFFDLSGGVNVYVALNAFVLVFTLVCYAGYIVRSKLYKNPLKLVTVLLFSAMLPVGACALAFVNASVDYHNLMLMGYSVFYLFFLVLYEKGEASAQKEICIRRWVILLAAAVMIANQVVIANVSYHKAQMAYERSYGVLVRIADRIEQTDGAEDCEKILVLGALENSEAYSANLPPDITGITDGYILRADDEIVGQSVLCSALSDYCEKNYAFLSGEEKTALAAREDVRAMHKWPAKDSFLVIDDTLVIKFSNEGEKQ